MSIQENDQEQIKIADEHYVNEATLELLSRRIDSEVKSSFLKWVGLPIGGAGLVAILWAILFFLPNEVGNFIGQTRLCKKS